MCHFFDFTFGGICRKCSHYNSMLLLLFAGFHSEIIIICKLVIYICLQYASSFFAWHCSPLFVYWIWEKFTGLSFTYWYIFYTSVLPPFSVNFNAATVFYDSWKFHTMSSESKLSPSVWPLCTAPVHVSHWPRPSAQCRMHQTASPDLLWDCEWITHRNTSLTLFSPMICQMSYLKVISPHSPHAVAFLLLSILREKWDPVIHHVQFQTGWKEPFSCSVSTCWFPFSNLKSKGRFSSTSHGSMASLQWAFN